MSEPRLTATYVLRADPSSVAARAEALDDEQSVEVGHRSHHLHTVGLVGQARVAEIGFPLDVNRLRASSIACTGQPLCNYAVAGTKTKLEEIVNHLERTLGRDAEGLRLNVDGCPHACGHYWIGDIGLQGTTARDRGEEGEKQEAYEMYLRGGLGADAAIGRAIVRRVPADQAHLYVERLARAYLAERQDGDGFKAFADRHTDEELIAIATSRPLAEIIAEQERRPVHRERRHE